MTDIEIAESTKPKKIKAIAKKLGLKNSEIIFIGTNRGLENDLVPREGYQLKTINAYGLERKKSIQNFKNLYKT